MHYPIRWTLPGMQRHSAIIAIGWLSITTCRELRVPQRQLLSGMWGPAGTRTIRVGAGGIMLPNHAPLVIAEQFGTLALLFLTVSI